MVRKSLLVALLLTVAAPLAAQEAPVEWTFGRPDGRAPVGVLEGQLLPRHKFEFGYRFIQRNYKGLWANSDSLTLAESLQEFSVVPRTLINQRHELSLAFAPASTLTLMARMTYSHRQREEWYASNDTLYYDQTSVKQLGDLQVSALYDVFHQGAYRSHLQLGVLVPTGAWNPTGSTPLSTRAQPVTYDMRAGGGTFAILPGMTMLGQNRYGSVGVQVRGTFYVGTNDKGFAPGNVYDFTAWAAYRLNDYFSVSARTRYERWDAINGADPDVAAYIYQDPGYNGRYVKGHRLDIPLGLNIYLPQGMHLGGNRISVEYLRTASQYFEGAQLGADWGLVIGWQTLF